ncbi:MULTISPECIES: hypothetical protein [Xanthomonas]|uniref:hypothetical protein n=1 Tax=Xanthomonas TaxID=338 RepID=UPI00096F6DCD|nr:hypothetical protein [Xanthomonas campestris]MCC5094972.1 hypothetical protein [Xanthomonas campestris pv. incanae]MEA9612224.1 hypothetical protein [Xanthomonas campestris pv. incanae]MEA9617644.1 hypothetical protein [Xanthomonas campestris pv. incanae]RFF42001.1 hypothetical protein D0A38_17325 [Xanthomonas campestris pv. incanae]WDJ09466.1 hypothetical protein JH299_18135 [Xanthomonas campestris pv. incanae]
MTTKAEFKKQLQHRIDAALGELGYSYNRSRAAFVKQTAACEARIGYDITAAGYPKNIVSADVLVFVDLPEVNRIGETLFAPPAVNPATLWGNLRLFTPANSARDTSYYFDVSGNGDQHVKALVEDLGIFDAFASKIFDLSALSNTHLSKLPRIYRNFAGGLTHDYKYGLPQLISIMHALNDEFAQARACADHAAHLTLAEKSALHAFIDARNAQPTGTTG